MIWITSGDRPSNGRLALQLAGGFRRPKTWKHLKNGDVLINWGASGIGIEAVNLVNLRVLNSPTSIRVAADKLKSFEQWSQANVSTVPWTRDKAVVQSWLETAHVVARTKLTGHSGEGIIIIEKGSTEIPNAPLFTKYINKTHEYRVHVINGHVVDVQRKIRDPDREPTNWKVRSHENGFIFARNDVVLSESGQHLAISAVSSLGLDFGAVDVVVDKVGVVYVLEVNTAPGLEGQTVQSYVQAFMSYYKQGLR